MKFINRIAGSSAAVTLTLAAAACGSATQGSAEEVVITCGTCQQSPTDPFLQYNYEAAQRFNELHAGQYRIETLDNANAGSGPDRLQYYQRLALADDLPDVFVLNAAEIRTMEDTGQLRDFTPLLQEEETWQSSFLPGAFDALTGTEGEVWAIPEQRDAIGMFYNQQLFASVGYEEFPDTWDEFEDAAAELKNEGITAVAADGDWATMLLWVNLIGTQPGGGEFLTETINAANWVEIPEVAQATETLRRWHTEGWVNSDAFSGDFQDAASAYLSESAAAVANGPWFAATNLTSDAAPEALHDNTGYTLAPGWTPDQRGVVEVTGGGWASGTSDSDEDKQQAVEEFLRFVTSPEESIIKAQDTGSQPPVEVEAEELEEAGVEPMSVELAAQVETAEYRYPHVRVHGPSGFSDAWKNLWPAYVAGEMDTSTFLTRLEQDIAPS